MSWRWREILLGAVLALGVAGAVAAGFYFGAPFAWGVTSRWQLSLEILGVAVALQVAAFALTQFWLERQRLSLYVGLAFLAATIADLVAALVSQDSYYAPRVERYRALVGIWTVGRLLMSGLLLAGLGAHGRAAISRAVGRELTVGALAAAAGTLLLVQAPLWVALPGLMVEGLEVRRPWDLAGGILFAAALPAYWWTYRQRRGVLVGAVLISLLIGLLAQVAAIQSAEPSDGLAMLAMVLKVASYVPPLVGLFVASVVLYREQQRLTVQVQTAQEELAKYSKHLEQTIAARTQEVEARARDLEVFAFTVSHDLKAPLRGIHAYAELLLDTCGPQLGEQGARFAQAIRRMSQTMRKLIDDLLEYSRLQRRDAVMSKVNLRELTQSVVHDRHPQIEQAGAEVTLEFADMVCEGDRMMFYQVLGNLLDNALKYSRGAKPPRITISGWVDHDRCCVAVADNGIGFDMEHAERIFSLFERLHPSEKYEGSGIGLSIVKRIIEKHGGQVWAEGKPGQGATFTFVVPQKQSAILPAT
jgi:signal transduction histidine kinase